MNHVSGLGKQISRTVGLTKQAGIFSPISNWVKRKAFNYAPGYWGGRRGASLGGQGGQMLGKMFGMGDQGQGLGAMAGRRLGRGLGETYGKLPGGQQDRMYGGLQGIDSMAQQGINTFRNFLG